MVVITPITAKRTRKKQKHNHHTFCRGVRVDMYVFCFILLLFDYCYFVFTSC